MVLNELLHVAYLKFDHGSKWMTVCCTLKTRNSLINNESIEEDTPQQNSKMRSFKLERKK